MQLNALWPLLSLLAAVVAFIPVIADSSHRSAVYWLVIPPLVAGILAAWTHFGVW